MRKPTWWDPAEIRYTYPQLLWLLGHLHALEAGCYPEIDNELKLPGGDIMQIRKGCARSVMLYRPNPDALRIARELHARLLLCQRDGQVVKARFVEKRSMEEVCCQFGLESRMVYYCTRRCLDFMQGSARPKGGYQHRQLQ